MMMVLMVIQLGRGPATGQSREEKGQSKSNPFGAHRVVVHGTHLIPCTLPLQESQVVAALAPGPSALKIGEVARRSGLPIKTISIYSEEGLIHARPWPGSAPQRWRARSSGGCRWP